MRRILLLLTVALVMVVTMLVAGIVPAVAAPRTCEEVPEDGTLCRHSVVTPSGNINTQQHSRDVVTFPSGERGAVVGQNKVPASSTFTDTITPSGNTNVSSHVNTKQ